MPVQQRIDFKIATLVFKWFTGCAPSYFSELLSFTSLTRLAIRLADDCCTFPYRANEILVTAVFPSMHPKFGTLFPTKFEMLTLSAVSVLS